jgi:hypothetical protein
MKWVKLTKTFQHSRRTRPNYQWPDRIFHSYRLHSNCHTEDSSLDPNWGWITIANQRKKNKIIPMNRSIQMRACLKELERKK